MDLFAWHAVLMLVAWLVLVPLGVLLARFFKIMPGQDWPRRLDNRLWWYGHLLCGLGAFALMLLSIWMAVTASGGLEFSGHALFGLSATGLALFQVLSGLLRGSKGGPTDNGAVPDDPATWRGDHYDMTPRRVVFEAWHKAAGYAALALALVAIATGLALLGWSDALLAWMVVWLLGYLLIHVLLERAGLASDTYRAIWGPDEAHPGNRRDPRKP